MKKILCENCKFGGFNGGSKKSIYCSKTNIPVSKYLNDFGIALIEDIPKHILQKCSGYKQHKTIISNENSFSVNIQSLRGAK